MAGIEEFADRWNSMAQDANFLDNTILKTGPRLVEVNQQQLLDGKDNKGGNLDQLSPTFRRKGIPGTYRPFKLTMNPRAEGRYDMNLTNRSFSTMQLVLQAREFNIVGAGWADKYDKGQVEFATHLEGRIWGIHQSDYLLHYKTTYLYPLIQESIRQYMQL